MIPWDREKLAKRTKAEILDEVQGLLTENDQAHGRRLRLQAESVRHLLAGRDYSQEMGVLHQRITTLEAQLEQAQDELQRLRGAASSLNPPQAF